jgi:hypothetical protein
MNGWTDQFRNGVSTRKVHYNGKTWNDHKIDYNGRHFVSVFATDTQTWPRTFGTDRAAAHQR